jgi:transcriptional regulator with XRE-family HTH domain
MTTPLPAPVGAQIRQWRTRRRLSQLELALAADVSTRHLSYLENGRSAPSREMILRLARRLDVPLRERNRLLTAACAAPLSGGGAPDGPARAAAREVVELGLRAHGPFPALAVDRHWNVAMQNRAVALLLEGVAPELLAAPVNALRLSLHPLGMAPRIANLGAWRAHVLHRLGQQIAASGDETLRALAAELDALGPGGGTVIAPLRPPPAGSQSPASSPLVIDTRPAGCRSSARRPCSARRSTSRCRSRARIVPSRRPGATAARCAAPPAAAAGERDE